MGTTGATAERGRDHRGSVAGSAYGRTSRAALGGNHRAPYVSLDELFACSGGKYPHAEGFAVRVLTALVDFDIADQEEEPVLLQHVKWEQDKAFFVNEARRLGQQWFGGPGY
jgi:hypothetical protein